MTAQNPIVVQPLRTSPGHKTWLEGPAGTGKTTTAARTLVSLTAQGVPAGQILVLLPQRTLARPYQEAVRALPAGPQPTILTSGGLARRMVDLFWPLVAEAAGFAQPGLPPTFLTLETAQYYMAAVAGPLIDQEMLFHSVALERTRLYSQVLDNLNKAALAGFSSETIGQRLSDAWAGESSHKYVYADAQRCASLFRAHCLAHNLLDYSLQVEVFRDFLWPLPELRNWLNARTAYLIADNLEEDSPFSHRLIADWLPALHGALLIYDREAGYRSFLSADPSGAYGLRSLCDTQLEFTTSHVTAPELETFGRTVARVLGQDQRLDRQAAGLPPQVVIHQDARFYPEMMDGAVSAVTHLVQAGTPPGQIAILSPFLSDSLRFGLTTRLDQAGIPWRSHRPSRPFLAEPAAGALLTLATLATPALKRPVNSDALTRAFMQAISGLDFSRACLLASMCRPPKAQDGELLPWEMIQESFRTRITYPVGEKYEILRRWLAEVAGGEVLELDFLLSRLFGELLSQPGFGFHTHFDRGSVTAALVESAAKFRQALPELEHDPLQLTRLYFDMLEKGLITAQYLSNWQEEDSDSVILSPAFTFLLANRPVDALVLVDVASDAWFRRLYQPLTHPYVLSANWQPGRLWTDADEDANNRSTLSRLVLGLLRRCREEAHFLWSERGEDGLEQRGMLLRALYQVQLLEGGQHG